MEYLGSFFDPGDLFIAYRYNQTYLRPVNYLQDEPLVSWFVIIVCAICFLFGVPGNTLVSEAYGMRS